MFGSLEAKASVMYLLLLAYFEQNLDLRLGLNWERQCKFLKCILNC